MTTNSERSQNLSLRPNRTFICSVVFIDIVEYSKKSVDEQIHLKERFNTLLSEAIADISVNDRIILDTGDGAAVGFLGDPEDALFVAMSLRDSLRDDQNEAAPDLQIRMGINLGPVKLLRDINNQMNLIGDGINVSQRIMSFAEPGQLMVSRSYYDIVSCLSQEYAKLFQYQGARADKHVREHDIYAVEPMRVDAMSIHGKRGKKPEAALTESAVDDDEKLSTEQAGVVRPAAATQPAKPEKNKKMLIIGGAVAAAFIALFIMMPKGKTPVDATKTAAQSKSEATSPSSKSPKAEAAASLTETTSRKRASEIQTETQTKTVRAVSAEARDILFTVTGLESSGSGITVAMKAHNKSSVVKSVALYDDSNRWTKSMVTDSSGKKHGVNTVRFVKGSKRIAMSEAGTEGIHIAPGESITILLTFKKDSKGIRALNLHPFIYQGRRDWKEYDLAMNLKS
jgi:class 3 adenylate cyclase